MILTCFIEETNEKEARSEWWQGSASHWKPRNTAGTLPQTGATVISSEHLGPLDRTFFLSSVKNDHPEYFQNLELPSESRSLKEYMSDLDGCIAGPQFENIRKRLNQKIALAWPPKELKVEEAKKAYLNMLRQEAEHAPNLLDLSDD